MSYNLGIDIGTAFTAAALGHGTHVEMLALSDVALVAPSMVFATREGTLLTGEEAMRRAESEPARAVHEFKRRLGDPTPIVLGDQGYSPMELMAAVVRDVIARARAVTGADPRSVTLTRPAIWGPYRLEQFAEVPALAGLEQCQVVTEPEAAASFYLSNNQPPVGSMMVVYDLGAGTFDTAVLRADGDRIELVGDAEGADGAGGAAFDRVVLGMVDEHLHGAVSRLDPGHPMEAAVLARLRRDAIRAKEALSTEPEIVMPFFLADGLHEVRLSRTEFEHRIAPIVELTIEAVWRALHATATDPSALDAFLLSGGSSRVPLVGRRLEAEFGRPVQMFGHPKHVIALGAASMSGADADTSVVPAGAAKRRSRRPAGASRRRPLRTRIGRRIATVALTLAVVAGVVAGAMWMGSGGSVAPPDRAAPTTRPGVALGPQYGPPTPIPSVPATPSLSATPSPSASPTPTPVPTFPSTAATSGPAAAPPAAPRYKLLNRLSHKVLAVPNRSTAPNTVLIQTTETGDPSEHWLVADAGNGRVRITNVASGLSIAPLNGQATPLTYVAQVNNVGEPAILWEIVDDGEGWLNIRQSNGLVLAMDAQSDADGVQAFLYEYNTTWDHDWKLIPVT